MLIFVLNQLNSKILNYKFKRSHKKKIISWVKIRVIIVIATNYSDFLTILTCFANMSIPLHYYKIKISKTK